VNHGIVREMAGQFGLRFRLPRKSQGSFTCRKSAKWDRRLHFPYEGRHAVDFFARKIRSLNPRSWVSEASMLTTRTPKSLHGYCTVSSVSLAFITGCLMNWELTDEALRLLHLPSAICLCCEARGRAVGA
jgi:hypothetical protein